MSKFSKWMAGTLVLILSLLLLAGGAVAAVDPFFHYHARLPHLAYPFDNEYYQNPGIVQNFEYDSLLTGSSVTAQFKPSLFKQLTGTEMVKVNLSDVSPLMLNKLLSLALEENEGLKTVYSGMDHWSLSRNPDRMYLELPDYLYDQNPFNDAPYVLNKQVLLENTLAVAENTLGQRAYSDFDTAYTQNYTTFVTRESVAVAHYLAHQVPISSAGTYDRDILMTNTHANLEKNLLPLITANPDVKFVIFFPPGSVLYWYDTMLYRDMDDAFEQLAIYTEALLAQPNVELYNFMGVEEIVCNLYNYFDWIHYRPEVHEYMTYAMAEGRHRLTAENWREDLAATRALVEGYDYEALFGSEAYPFKAAATLYDYVQGLNDPRYTVLAAWQGGAGAEVPAPMAETLAALGLQGFGGQPTGNYTAAASGGAALFEAVDAPAEAAALQLGGQAVSLSASADAGGNASIMIGNMEYAQWLPGLNLVVWDEEAGRVVDSAAFPLEAQPAPQRRTEPRL